MRKFIIAFVTILASFATFADDNTVKITRDLMCFPIATLLTGLKDQYGEESIVMGIANKEKEIGTGLYVNPVTGSYTVIEFTRNAGCILSSGTNVGYRLPVYPGVHL